MKPDFKKSPDGLLPAVVQDAATARVLMLGYMNEAAFEKSRKEGKLTFFSRSKQRLWTKGEESGNFLELQSLYLDCDSDAILAKVIPAGPVCHTGNDTCFKESNTRAGFLAELERLICERKEKPASGSYVSGLFAKGINRIAQKVGEEATELVIAAKDSNPEAFKEEAADLLFHYLVLLAEKGTSLHEIEGLLQRRNSKKSENVQKA